ncbi:MAG: TM2 domain-containing protein [Breznakia sp.]
MEMNNQVRIYIANNARCFPFDKLIYIKQKMENLNEDQFMNILALDLKNPTTMLIISVVTGPLAIDRFMLGEIGTGLLKLFTAGLCGILTIFDWFTIQGKTKKRNFSKIMRVL